jgi:hypothetical protein
MANPTPSLLPQTRFPLIHNATWDELPTEEEMVQVNKLLGKLAPLKTLKLMGAIMALSFCKQLT